MANSKMICPRCSGEMNHHADKLVYPAAGDETRYTQSDLGGRIEETYGCPGCGGVESRRAE